MTISTSLASRLQRGDDKPPPDVADRLERCRPARADGLAAEATRSRLVAALARIEIERGDARRSGVSRHPAADRNGPAADPSSSPTSTPLLRSGGDRAVAPGDQPWARRSHVSQAALGRLRLVPAAVHGNATHGDRRTHRHRRWSARTARPDRSDPRDGGTNPSVRPPRIPSWRLLAELRSHEMTLADPSASEQERQEAERNHTRLEREVRRKARTTRGDASAGIACIGRSKSALGLLGERQLLGHARLDGRLYAVSVIDAAGLGCTTSGRSTTSTNGSRR